MSIALWCLFGAVPLTVHTGTPFCPSPLLLQQQLVHLVGADVHHLEDARALELLVDISIDRGTACRVEVVSGVLLPAASSSDCSSQRGNPFTSAACLWGKDTPVPD